MWCGGVFCGGPLWCVALWFVELCCNVVRWLVMVVFALRRFVLACFVAFLLLHGFLVACCSVDMLVAPHCCVVWRRDILCVVVFYRDVVWFFYCVVAVGVLWCRVASWCVGLYVGVWHWVWSRGVVCCCLVVGCIVQHFVLSCIVVRLFVSGWCVFLEGLLF